MKYFVYAYPAMYGGLHGMYNYEVVDCDSYDTAVEIGVDMAREVIDSYNLAYEIYSEEDYREEYDIPEDQDVGMDFYDVLDEAIGEELGVEVYRLKDDSYEDIIRESNDDPHTIIEKYCENID